MIHVRKDSRLHMYTYTFREADTWRERRHECDVRANTKWRGHNEIRGPFARDKDKGLRWLTSVTMIPVIGPRKTV